MSPRRATPQLLAVARGDAPADLLLTGGRVFVPSTREWIVTDGPSLAFIRSTHRTQVEAEARADEYLAQQSRGGTIDVFDVDTRDELPEWVQGAATLSR